MNQKSATSKNHPGQRFWEAHINAQAKSGMTRAEYCRQQNLSYWAFDYWKRKCREKNPAVSFVPVRVQQDYPPKINHSSPVLKIDTGRFKVEVPDYFSSETLGRILQTIEDLR